MTLFYTTKEASQFRNKVAKIILAEINVETFNSFIVFAISFKHMLKTCFKVISQNCQKGFPILHCNSWSLLDFGHFFLILLSWLRSHVQSQQQKHKVRFGSSLRGGLVGGFVGGSSFGLFLQSVTKYLRLTLVFMWKSVPRGKFNRYFSGPFC